MGRVLSILVLLIVLSGVALADYLAFSGSGEIPICQGSMQVDTIFVKNTGTDEIVLEIEGSSWSTYLPETVTLKGGEQLPIYNFIRPGEAEPGLYEISTKIINEVTKELKQVVSISECPRTVVSAGESFSNCPCTPTYYAFTIENTGDDYETYALGVNSEYVIIDDNPVTIPPNETYTVYVTAELPCDMTGDYVFTFITQAASTGFRTETPFYLSSRQGCFGYTLELGNAVLTEEFIPKDSEYMICNRQNLIPIKFTNSGEFETSIDYNATELGITGTLTLEKGAEDVIYLPVDMPKGEYMYSLKTSNEKTDKDISFVVDVLECEEDEEFPEESSFLNVILIVILIIIVFFVAFSVIKEGSDEFEKPKKQRQPLSKTWKLIISVILVILLLVGLVFVLHLVGINVLDWVFGVFNSIFSFVKLYWLYFLIGIVAALIIIFIHWKESWFKATSMYFLIVVIAGVVFLLLSMCFFGGICKVEMTEDDSLKESSTIYITNMNQEKKIKLSKFVNNPDNDELNFMVTPVDSLDIVFEDSNAFITPAEGFTGERVINFIVEDSYGARAISPDITIIVLDREAKFYDSIISFIGRFTNIFLFLVLVAVVVIILLILRTQRPKKRIVKRKRKVNK